MSTMRVRSAALILASIIPTVVAQSAEPPMPKRPKELNRVIKMGEEAGHMLDHMPIEEESSEAEQEEGTSTSYWVLMIVFNSVGIGFFIYGKKQARPLILVCGVLLMVFPYFVTNAALTALVGCLICAAPWGLRRLGVG